MRNAVTEERRPVEDGASGNKKSAIVVSRRGADMSDTEVTAAISVPRDGGWGWIVVLAAFCCIFILDGTAFTFGSVFQDMTEDLEVSESAVALVNSLAVAVYFLGAPLGSAVINRFGFRLCVMVGSVICSLSLAITYFSTSYGAIVFFYGACAGCGYCLVNLASILVVGFYFERLRSLALALTATGSSIGIMVMFPVNSYIVDVAGWRVLAMLQSGMFGFIYFLGTAYRPLLELTVTKTVEQQPDVKMYMPSLANLSATRDAAGASAKAPGQLTATEKMFNAISSPGFPTVSQMMKQSYDSMDDDDDPKKGKRDAASNRAGPSTSAKARLTPVKAPASSNRSRMTITAANPRGAISHAQLKHVASTVSRASDRNKFLENLTQEPNSARDQKSGEQSRKLYQIRSADETEIAAEDKSEDSNKKLLELRKLEDTDSSEKESKMMSMEVRGGSEAEEEATQKHGCWYWLCHWEKHVESSRPMYRDDAFYEGGVKHLPQYKASQVSSRTGIEYQMEVTRAVAVADLEDRRTLLSTAVRRVLATMMDPKLLQRRSFICLSMWAFLTYLGYLVPYIFLKERNMRGGIDPQHCSLFVSAIGLSNAVGRIVLGTLAWKLDTSAIFTGSVIVAGLGTMVSHLSYDVYYQYGYCCMYGFCVASIACLRSLVLVELYGLDKLTNATGMLLLFQGVGSLIGTPLASALKVSFGFGPTFLLAGGFITLGGVCLIPVKNLAREENIDAEKNYE